MPTWVVVSCATAIALGTYCGGWRIIKTLGTKVVEVRPPQGFGSEAVAATVILASSHVGFPLSTTQVVSGAVTGSGVGRPGADVNWGVAGRIVIGWMLTLPAAAATAGGRLRDHRPVRRRRPRPGRSSASPSPSAARMLYIANRRQAVEPEETVSEHPAFGPHRRPSRWPHDRRDRLGRAAARPPGSSVGVGLGVLLVATLGGDVVAAQPGRARGRQRRRRDRLRSGDRRCAWRASWPPS